MKELRGEAVFFAQYSEQKMFGTDVAMFQALCFLGCVREDPLAFIGKRQVDRCRQFFSNRKTSLDFIAKAVDRCSIAEKTISQVPVFTDESQQQVLRFDAHTAELTGFV